jgi:hypothetical protein
MPTWPRRRRLSSRSPPRQRSASHSAPRTTRIGKVRKAFWLDPGLLDEARTLLGASTEREAVEMALDLVLFRKQLAQSATALRRLTLSRID